MPTPFSVKGIDDHRLTIRVEDMDYSVGEGLNDADYKFIENHISGVDDRKAAELVKDRIEKAVNAPRGEGGVPIPLMHGQKPTPISTDSIEARQKMHTELERVVAARNQRKNPSPNIEVLDHNATAKTRNLYIQEKIDTAKAANVELQKQYAAALEEYNSKGIIAGIWTRLTTGQPAPPPTISAPEMQKMGERGRINTTSLTQSILLSNRQFDEIEREVAQAASMGLSGLHKNILAQAGSKWCFWTSHLIDWAGEAIKHVEQKVTEANEARQAMLEKVATCISTVVSLAVPPPFGSLIGGAIKIICTAKSAKEATGGLVGHFGGDDYKEKAETATEKVDVGGKLTSILPMEQVKIPNPDPKDANELKENCVQFLSQQLKYILQSQADSTVQYYQQTDNARKLVRAAWLLLGLPTPGDNRNLKEDVQRICLRFVLTKQNRENQKLVGPSLQGYNEKKLRIIGVFAKTYWATYLVHKRTKKDETGVRIESSVITDSVIKKALSDDQIIRTVESEVSESSRPTDPVDLYLGGFFTTAASGSRVSRNNLYKWSKTMSEGEGMQKVRQILDPKGSS